jgi:hypothetical protein
MPCLWYRFDKKVLIKQITSSNELKRLAWAGFKYRLTRLPLHEDKNYGLYLGPHSGQI